MLPLTQIQNNGNAEFRPRLSLWLQSGKFAEIGCLSAMLSFGIIATEIAEDSPFVQSKII